MNLIGEHVDYNGGMVMPIAIAPAIYSVSARRCDNRIQVFSRHANETVELSEGAMPPTEGWGVYVHGIVAVLHEKKIRLSGANVLIDGDLPPGGGLSSSAAVTAAIGLALLSLSGQEMSRRELARCCRDAERLHAGVPCGIMDPSACLLSRAGQVMLLDCSNEEAEYIPWPGGDARVVIVDSRSPHRLSSDSYATRVRECQQVLQTMNDRPSTSPVANLGKLSMNQLTPYVGLLEPTLLSRARHVVSEIGRVRDAADALRTGNVVQFGSLMNESHRSLSVDYEVSTSRMDHLASIIRNVPGVLGARLTGGGFGGCVVAMAESSSIHDVETAVRKAYDAAYGVSAQIWVTRPCDGARVDLLD